MDQWSISHIEEILASLGGSTVSSALDLRVPIGRSTWNQMRIKQKVLLFVTEDSMNLMFFHSELVRPCHYSKN